MPFPVVAVVLAHSGEPVRVVLEQHSNNGALVVAIVSAAIAGFALALTLRREMRDRPDIFVEAMPGGDPDGDVGVHITVENRGRQPITVAAIGLQWNIKPSLPDTDVQGEISANDPWSRTRLEAGGHTHVSWEPDRAVVHLDTPMRGFVDVGGRRVYARRPYAYLRMLHLMGGSPRRRFPRDIVETRVARLTRWLLYHGGSYGGLESFAPTSGPLSFQ